MITRPHVRVLVLCAFALVCVAPIPVRTAVVPAGALPQNPIGEVSGTVIDAVTKKPVADARVTLRPVGRINPGEGRVATDPNQSRPREVLTASNGVFHFSSMGPGRYFLTARKPGYLTVYFGQQQSDDAMQWFDMRQDEMVSGVSLRMWPGAVISGRVHTASGAPLAGKWVQLFDLRPDNGLPHIRMASLPSQATDSRGEYRIPDVPPGRYLLRVADRESHWVMDVLQPTGHVEPPCVCAFYPQAGSVLGAEVIIVAGGEERTHVDVDLPDSGELPAYEIRGRIAGMTFDPYNRKAHLVLADRMPDLPPYVEIATAVIQPNGSFVFPYVPPGRYLIRGVLSPLPLTAFQVPPDPSDPVRAPHRPIEQATWGPTAWFSESVTVADQALTDVTVQARPGSRVRGKITLGPELTGLDLAGLSVTARALDGWDLEGVPNGRVERDGTFTSPSLPPGKFLVLPDERDNYWFADSARLFNREVIATGFDVGTSDVSGLEITLTNRASRVSGTVMDAAGKVRPDAHVLFFRRDGSWLGGDFGLAGTDVGNLRTDRFGNYEVTLHAGDYLIVAVAGDIPGAWQDPVFLQSLIPFATKVTVAKGAALTEGLTARVLQKK